ncbi:TPA: phage tail family protein [Clostridium botulinum]|uniref:distal tail protein Dit n=1 Tax=Clostridium botulinum TaxID=1491 RepID=UPI0029BAEA20|nr:phage tail family protein [Clostridium botulinum]HDK7188702.1 phage tail family protein [Clostridium botulinum]HDK7215621.1 phage tail family protein [Clostridium botulinum]HDK7231375.1 phage tail family protein [Clostridium botulinum]HDK7260733.1 phage tail family protein [Clostridium botulinum]
MESGFIWNGIHSSEKGFKIISLPNITTPEKRVEKVVVPGRNGYLTITENDYEGEVKSVEFDYFDDYFDDIKQWLTGSGEVIFSNEPDRYYKATIINKISLDQMLKKFYSGIVEFDCQPFGHDLNDLNIIKITENNVTRNSKVIHPLNTLNYTSGNLVEVNKLATINENNSIEIFNPGTIESNPVITIYGYGNVDLNINDNIINFTNVANHITVDSEIIDCYRDGQLMNNYMKGDFPIFKIGINKISWMGNVQRFEIKPNWGWL